MPSYRSLKIAEAIKNSLTLILQGDIADERIGGVTVLSVALTKDNSHARVYFTVYDENFAEVEKILNKAAGYIRTQLAQCLSVRHTPSLSFIYDKNFAANQQLEQIFEKIRNNREHQGDEQS
jgi:ribosome-binding factor A